MLLNTRPNTAWQLKAEHPALLKWSPIEDVAVAISINLNANHSQSVTVNILILVSLGKAATKFIQVFQPYQSINEILTGPVVKKAPQLEWTQSPIGSIVTPQSPYLCADIFFSLDDRSWSTLRLELAQTISTSTQTAVKQKDEQEFVTLISDNLVFSKDAAQRIKPTLNQAGLVNELEFN